MMHALDNTKNNTNDVLLTTILKVFAIFMLNLDYEQNVIGTYFISLAMKCAN